MQSKKYLALDPAFRNTGFSVWNDEGKLLTTGVIRPIKINDKNLRKAEQYIIQIRDIWKKLTDLINLHRIDHVISEIPGGSRSAQAAKLLAFTTCIVGLLPEIGDVELTTVTEKEVKLFIFNDFKVSKNKTMEYVLNKYGEEYNFPECKKDLEHICDSIIIFEYFSKNINK